MRYLPLRKTIPALLLPALLLLASGAQALPKSSGSSGSQTGGVSSKQPSELPAKQQKPPALLPPDFAGMPREGNLVINADPGAVDPAHAGVLKEDGLVEAASARYVGAAGTGWSVQALRFADATGAFSAFTFYRDPAMQPEAVGQNSAANAGIFLMQNNITLVMVRPQAGGTTQDATQLLPAMSALVSVLPTAQGPDAVAPALPALLSPAGLEKGSLHYAIGPSSYNGPIPANVIEFNKDAEAVTARYQLPSGGGATLTLLMLPTPQIAGSSVRAVLALPDAALHVATRRSGPLVGVVSGAGVSQAEAQQLLSKIHYVADITVDQPQGYISEVAKTAKLLLGIAYLTGVLAIAAVVIAFFLGAGRVALRRLRGKPDSSMNDDDFISLKL